MATYYFRNTGDTNWGTASNWSLTDGGGATGAVPTSADDAYFTSNSGNCTVNTSARVCKTLIFSGVGAGNYSGTITMTFGITVSGNVTLSATMGISGTANLTVNETSTLTSNGKTWSAGFIFSGVDKTYTLADNWTFSGSLQLFGLAGSTFTINGNILYSSGNLIHNGIALSGTTNIELLTGCTWTNSNSSNINNNLSINGNVTISGTVYYGTGTLTYISGVVTVAGSTLVLNVSSTLNISGMTWNNVLLSGGTKTLLSNLNIGGLLSTGSNLNISGNFSINCSGGISLFGGIFQGTGTTTLNLLGGTWSTTAATGRIAINTNINGNITISGTVYYDTRTLTYTSGTITVTGSTLSLSGTTTLNTSGMTWNNVTAQGVTLTLTSQLNVSGTFSVVVTSSTVNGGTINCTGSASSATLNGTGTLLMSGTGTLGGIYGSINLTINTVGTITITGTLNKGGGTFTYTAGTVSVGTSTLLIYSGTTLNISGVTWNNVTINDQTTVTLSANLNVGGILTLGSGTNFCVINGAFNINANGNVTVGGTIPITGTATLVFAGTGTWSNSSTAPLRLNTTINTAGTLTISGTVRYDTGTLTYTAGTISHISSSTLTIGASTTLNTSGMSWNNVTFSATNTTTLTSDLNINGLLTISGATTVNGSFNINANGGTTLSGVSIGKLTGTPKLYFKGGTVSSTNTLGRISLDSYIDGNITIGTLLIIGDNGSINYVSGVVTNTANNTVTFANLNVSINLAGVTLNNVTFTSATNNYTITLLSDLTLNGLLTTTGGTISGSYNINVSGGVTVINNGIFAQGTGITTLNLLGGTWSISGTGSIRLNTVINGNITISGNVYYNTGTLTYTSGTVSHVSSSTINIAAATTIAVNNSGLTLENITATANVTFSGTNGCTINGTYSCSTAGVTHIFASTRTYTINTLSVSGTNASRNTLRSSTPGSKAILNFTSISVNYRTNVIDINSSGGAAGWTFGGTLSNTDNWNVSTTLYYVGTANFVAAGSWSPYSGGIGIISVSTPAAGEAIAFDANSVNNCNVNGTPSCGSIDFTGYSKTITFSSILYATATSIILSPTMDIVTPSVIPGFSPSTIGGIGLHVVGGSCTFTSNGKIFTGNFTCSPPGGGGLNLTLTDELTVTGYFALINAGTNLLGGFPLNCYGGFGGTGLIGGTTNIYGGINRPAFQLATVNFYGNVTLLAFGTVGGTYTIRSGFVNASTATLTINTYNTTFINFDKAVFRGVSVIFGNPTLIFNRFFSGTPTIRTRIQTTVGSNYTVAFTDNFEKITKFVRISNCTLSRPGQLLCLTPNSDKGGNRGIRYYNQSPNSIPKDSPSITDPMVYGTAPGVADPLFVTS